MNKRSKSLLLFTSLVCALTLAAILLFRCGDLLEQDPFARAYNSYLKDCSQCHKPGTSQYQDVNLDMSTESKAKTSLRSAADIPAKPNCTGLPFVVPGDPDNSMLMAVLDDSLRAAYTANNGGCPPLDIVSMGSFPPDASTLSDIRTWISEGAQ